MSLYHKTLPQLAFFIESMAPSELIFRILMDSMEQDKYNCLVFWEQLSRAPTKHLCANMHVSEAYGYNGPVIATSLKTAYKLLQFPSPNPKFFFLNDIEWLRFPHKQFEVLESIYRNRELNLLVRSEDHKKLVESCWNRKVDMVVNNYDFWNEDFVNYLEGKIEGAGKRKEPTVQYKSVVDYL